MQQRQPLGSLTSSRLIPVSFAPDRERTPSPVRSRTPSGVRENSRSTPTISRHNNNGAGTSSNPSRQEADAAATLLGLSAVTPPQSPRQLVTPSAPQRGSDGAGQLVGRFRDGSVSPPALILPLNMLVPSQNIQSPISSSQGDSLQADSPMGRYLAGVPASLNGTGHRQAMNGEPPRRHSQSPV